MVRGKRVKLSAFSREGWLFALLVSVLLCGGCDAYLWGEGYEPILVVIVTYIRLLLRVGIKVVDE